MLITVFAIIGVFTLAKWLLPILFPQTAFKIRLALFAGAMARVMQHQAERMQKEAADQPRP